MTAASGRRGAGIAGTGARRAWPPAGARRVGGPVLVPVGERTGGRSTCRRGPPGWSPPGRLLIDRGASGRLATARVPHGPSPLRARGRGRWALIVLPVVLVLVLPPATLSGYALGRRGGFVGSGVSTSTCDIASGTLSFIDVAAAQIVEGGHGRAAVARAASRSRWRDSCGVRRRAADEILLTRYVVTCCVADATIAQVRVVNVPAGTFQPDQWVRVTDADLSARARDHRGRERVPASRARRGPTSPRSASPDQALDARSSAQVTADQVQPMRRRREPCALREPIERPSRASPQGRRRPSRPRPRRSSSRSGGGGGRSAPPSARSGRTPRR